MKKFFFLVFIFFCVLNSYALQGADDEIKIYLGETKILPASNPTRIVIANPNVIDVIRVTKQEMTIAAKAPGKTTLVFWDNYGEQAYGVKVFSEDIVDVKRRVDNMLEKLDLSEVYTKAEEEEGKVILLGRVKTQQEKDKIGLALGALKEKTLDLISVKEEESIVEIDVQVLELDKGATDTLGFTWPGSLNFLEVGSPGIGALGTTWGKVFKLLKVERGTSAGVDPYTLKIDALIQEGKARILSRPRVSCQSGKEAELLVGGEKPVFTTSVASTVGTSTQVEYKEFGIKLKVKPTVTPDERIKLGLNIEVSEVGDAETIGAANAPTAKAYPLSKRTASTELFLDDGQTMAIGGLIKQKSEEDVRKVPVLGNMPFFGAFFRQRTKKSGSGSSTKGDTELFITITPRIVSDDKAVAKEKKVSPMPPAREQKNEVMPAVHPDMSTPEARYAAIIQRRILASLAYPIPAKEAGFKGTVKLSLHISYKGELLDSLVKSSSGYKILDDNALTCAQAIGVYPPFPSSIAQKDLWIDIPVEYRLD